MKFSVAKVTAAVLVATACFSAGSIRAEAAEGIFSTTAVAGFSLSMNRFINSIEDTMAVGINIDVNPNVDPKTDPLAAGATETRTIKVPEKTTTEAATKTVKTAKAQKTANKKTEEKEESSKYEKLALAKVNNYLNIRKKPAEDAEIVGKLYKGAAGEIIKKDKNGWVKIQSGDVTGWVKEEFLVTGNNIPEYAEEICGKKATVTTETLKVREKASTDAKVVTLIPEGEEFQVLKEKKEWIAIKVDEDVRGFVSKDYVDIEFDFDDAVSIEEEKRADEEAARLAEEQEQSQNSNNNSSGNSNNSNSGSSSNNSSSNSTNKNDSGSSVPSSSSGSSVANYALQFVGNPYVYGGTSLTNGTDCSGFTMSVYKNFGVSINRTSRAQASNGRAVSTDEVQPGDLIFYKNGSTIGHVAIYIGNGQVVHASSRKTGIKVSNMNYRTPYCARRIIN